jgi:hypothetical protein
LFGILDDDDISKNLTCVPNFTEKQAYAVAMRKEYGDSPDERKPFLRALFKEDDDFKNFRERVAKVLFSRLEIPLGIVFFVIFFSLWWFPTSFPPSFAGVTGHPYVYIHWCIITGFWFIEALLIASFAKIFFAMLYGTFILSRKPEGLIIYKYLDFLRSPAMLAKDASDGHIDAHVVDLETFSKLTKPIGRVFTEVTVGIIGILIVLDLYWLILFPPSGTTPIDIYPILTLTAVLLMFFLPQIAMHLMLNEYKTVINEGLVGARMATNTQLLRGISEFRKQTLGRADDKLETEIGVNKIVVDVVDTMIAKLNSTRPWSIDISMVFKLFSVSTIDAVIWILGFF